MSPAYNSQATSNSPLQMIAAGDANPALLFNNEIPASGEASIAVAVQANTANADGGAYVSIQLECPGGIGAGVFQIQDSDICDTAGEDFTSINFNGATPGQITSANVNASGTARIELLTKARFIRVLCVTAPGAAVTVRASR